jgi:hypothetical protein
MAVPDFHDFANSIGSAAPRIPTTQASATFDVRWQASMRPIPLRDAANVYAGDVKARQATCTCSV